MSSGVTQVCLSARKPFLAVVSLKVGPPVVVELSKEQPTVTPLDGINLKGKPAWDQLKVSSVLNRCLQAVWCIKSSLGRHHAAVTWNAQSSSNPCGSSSFCRLTGSCASGYQLCCSCAGRQWRHQAAGPQ